MTRGCCRAVLLMLLLSPLTGIAAPRVITLAPHLAELVAAVGGGDHLVGVSRYSDHPPEIRGLPSVGDAFQFNEEQILTLRPTLVLAWGGGTPLSEIQRLRALQLPVEIIEVQRLPEVAAAMRRIGQLLGRAEAGREAAEAFEQRLETLRVRTGRPVAVFYQVSESPLYTLSDAHVASDVIRWCGGRNVFADAPVIAPQVSREAVLAARPELLLYSSPTGERPWRRLEAIPAVAQRQLHHIPADWLTRPGPRLLLGTERVCDHVSAVRSARSVPVDSPPGQAAGQ